MTIAYNIILAFLLILVCISGMVLYRFDRKKKILQKRNEVLRKEKDILVQQVHALELENSKFRLNPHLFKNTLNSIQAYAYRTHHALEKLGGVLDYILYDSEVPYTSVREELQFAYNFIELNKIKLSPLFDLSISVEADENEPLYEQKVMAPLITAHFIENAFKHGDLQSSDAFISIVFELKGEEFTLVVSNRINKNPIFNSKGGIGNENIRKRLEILYGNSCSLDYTVLDNVYTAYLKLNLLHVKDKMSPTGR